MNAGIMDVRNIQQMMDKRFDNLQDRFEVNLDLAILLFSIILFVEDIMLIVF